MSIPFLPRPRKVRRNPAANLWAQIRVAEAAEVVGRLANYGDTTIPTNSTHYATGQDGRTYVFRFQSNGTPYVERLDEDLRDDSLAGAWD